MKARTWAERRFRQKRATETKRRDPDTEKLVGCVLRRDGVEYGRDRQYRDHASLRREIGGTDLFDPYKPVAGDICGFLTNRGNFLDRRHARAIAHMAGQATSSGRELLSSDIDWWADFEPADG